MGPGGAGRVRLLGPAAPAAPARPPGPRLRRAPPRRRALRPAGPAHPAGGPAGARASRLVMRAAGGARARLDGKATPSTGGLGLPCGTAQCRRPSAGGSPLRATARVGRGVARARGHKALLPRARGPCRHRFRSRRPPTVARQSGALQSTTRMMVAYIMNYRRHPTTSSHHFTARPCALKPQPKPQHFRWAWVWLVVNRRYTMAQNEYVQPHRRVSYGCAGSHKHQDCAGNEKFQVQNHISHPCQ